MKKTVLTLSVLAALIAGCSGPDPDSPATARNVEIAMNRAEAAAEPPTKADAARAPDLQGLRAKDLAAAGLGAHGCSFQLGPERQLFVVGNDGAAAIRVGNVVRALKTPVASYRVLATGATAVGEGVRITVAPDPAAGQPVSDSTVIWPAKLMLSSANDGAVTVAGDWVCRS